MKREDVSKIFENATDEQINAILDIHSRDIGNAKKDYDTLLEELKKLNGTIETMTKELKELKDANASAECKNVLTYDDISDIIKSVKELYPEYPWR